MLAGKSIPVTLQRVSSSGWQEMWQWELERLQSYREWYLQQRLVTLHTCLFIYSFVRLQYWLTQQKPKWWPWDQQVDRLRLTPTCNKKKGVENVQATSLDHISPHGGAQYHRNCKTPKEKDCFCSAVSSFSTKMETQTALGNPKQKQTHPETSKWHKWWRLCATSVVHFSPLNKWRRSKLCLW